MSSADIKDLDGGLLLVFRELLRLQNASRTADVLGLSQSGVSHSLARLRKLFGDPLFIRRQRGLEPTPRARQLGPRIDALINLASESLRGAEAFDPAASRRLFRISAPEFLVAVLGDGLLAAFRRSAPAISLDFQFLGQEQALRAVRRGEIDLAIGRFARLSRPGLEIDEVLRDDYCCVVRHGHPVLKGKLSLAAYRRASHVFATSSSEVDPSETHPALAGAGVVYVPHWLTALIVVASSDHVATCPRSLASKLAPRLRLQILDLPASLGGAFTVHLARHQGTAEPGLAWLVGEIRACLGKAA